MDNNRKRITQNQLLDQAVVILGGVYFCWLTFGYITGIWALAITSTILGGCYAYVYWQIKKGKEPKKLIFFCYISFVFYIFLATAVLGFDSGLFFYLFGILAHWFFYVYDSRRDTRRRIPVAATILCGAMLVLLKCISGRLEIWNTLEQGWMTEGLFMINLIMAVVMISWFMYSFIKQILALEQEMKRKNDMLNELSQQDLLTGMANRRKLDEVQKESERRREKYALILGDIDDFKEVNDKYGHLVGDMVLKHMADVIRESIREADVACRWGGEEVLIFLPDCDMSKARQIGSRILERIRDMVILLENGEKLQITMTLGIADSEEGASFQEILHQADGKLYQGKESGKNCMVE